jgi:hypothetical protein
MNELKILLKHMKQYIDDGKLKYEDLTSDKPWILICAHTDFPDKDYEKLSDVYYDNEDSIHEELEEYIIEVSQHDGEERDYTFEIYLKNPETGETGWKIDTVEILAVNYPEAIKKLKKVKDFDTIIQDYNKPSFVK